MLAGSVPSIALVREVRSRGRQRGGAWEWADQDPLDDWLGDVSDDDWDEGAAERAEQRRAASIHHERRSPGGNTERVGVVGSPARAGPADTPARRAGGEQRPAIAALVVLLLGALGVAAAVLLVRDEPEGSGSTAAGFSTITTPARTETDPSATTPATTTPTTPSVNVATFTLPEGTKLQRGESVGASDLTVSTDPELVRELQRALAAAGFDPGSADGIFGESTEAAVVAFQQANGLSLDGIVGPETAEALNNAIAGG